MCLPYLDYLTFFIRKSNAKYSSRYTDTLYIFVKISIAKKLKLINLSHTCNKNNVIIICLRYMLNLINMKAG